jgi:hypothetical protein
MLNVQSYPQVEDINSLVPLLKSISLMATDPPTLSLLPPPNERSPIVGRVLTFDEMEGVHDQQTFGYPRIEDTSTLDHRPDNDATMKGVAKISGVTTSDDHVNTEFALWNANLDGCKEALPTFRSSDDDEDDRGHEKQSDVCLSNHLNITRMNSGKASRDRDSTPPECSKQGDQEAPDTVDYEMDVYEAAMCDSFDGSTNVFFRLEHSSTTASIPRNKVCLFFPFFSNVKMRFFPCRLFFFSYLCLIH